MNVSTGTLAHKTGSKIHDISSTFAGLGDRYFDKLKRAREKILQVDAMNGVTETAGAILDKSISIASALRHRNIHEGDRIVICSKMNMEMMPTILGIWHIGAIACPIDPNMDTAQSSDFLQKLHPKIAFTNIRAQGYIELALKGSNVSTCEIILFGRSTAYTAGTDKIFAKKPDDTFLPIKIMKSKWKSAFIVPSEGTTRNSRLVDISHYAVLSRCTSFESCLGQKIERVISFYPFPTFPNLITTVSALEEGVVRIITGPFSEKYACRLIHDLKVDLAILGTEIALKLASYLKSTRDFDLSSLKGLVTGLMTTSAKDMALIKASFPHTIVMNVYGCMECGYISGGAAPLKMETLQDTLTLENERLGTIGRAFENIKYKVVDLTSEKPVQQDTWGEMHVGGPAIMLGYYGDHNANTHAFQHGYYKTGDIVQFDDEDFLYIRGRIHDQLLRDGISYPASDLEEIVMMNPKVQEVAVIYEPAGNAAYVVLNDPKIKMKPEDLQAYVADFTPEFKRLHTVHFVEVLPKTTFGKVQKYKLKSSQILELSHSSLTMLKSLENLESKK